MPTKKQVRAQLNFYSTVGENDGGKDVNRTAAETEQQRKSIRSWVLYSELKRLTDLADHARGHGDLFIHPNIDTMNHVINQLEYGPHND